ncbi:MAG: hypothetical protein LBH94_06405, partial [Deltaproteobacteria bacterium]|nr:hypothetical protein [Deltaproteobacteria bacterium]
MSKAKKAATTKKGAKEEKKPAEAGTAIPKPAAQAAAGKRASVKRASRVPEESEREHPLENISKALDEMVSFAPAWSEAKLPAKSEAKLPVKKETHVPAVLPPRATTAPVQAGPDNPYLPEVATVAERIQETAQIVTLRLVLDDPAKMKDFTFKPGQVGQLSVFG